MTQPHRDDSQFRGGIGGHEHRGSALIGAGKRCAGRRRRARSFWAVCELSQATR